ncbi:MAG: hypothetical protein WA173_17665 [Pseudomonas sp.]|uniref:hypothetical protein n=1 Tax=Pseudomonas sp. TaxID=306 RepID=UPI003BB70014
MKLLILYIDIGRWDGGHDGQYPKVIAWDLENNERPMSISEGWGHGLGGGEYSLNEFMTSEWFSRLEEPKSQWARKIIAGKGATGQKKSVGQELLKESENHRFNLPSNLKEILGRWGYRVNA